MSDKLDTKEFKIPETTFSRDIETRVIQVIVIQTLCKIEGVGLIEGNLIDALFGRDVERVKGIHVEQESKTHSVKVKVEINVLYGISIPEKSEEVQEKIVEEIGALTGLHVSSVHVIVKGLIPKEDKKKEFSSLSPVLLDNSMEDDTFSQDF